MASNESVLLDGNGAASDWVELYNQGDETVDLAGYTLTDDPDELEKWTFPTTTLDPGEFLVVFASGNGIVDPLGNLHANFALGASGEYLALVDPSGTVLSEFGSSTQDYPPQVEDVSYGLAFDSTVSDVVVPGSSARYLIPTNSAVDATWTSPSLNDSGWSTGTASIGYENSPANYASLIQTAVPTGTTTVYVRIPLNLSESATLSTLQMKYDDGFVAYLNGTQIASANAPSSPNYASFATTDHPDAQAVQYVTYDVSGYSNLLQVGANTLAIRMLNRSNDSSDLLAIPKLTLASTGTLIEPTVEGFMFLPTPGAANTNLRANPVDFSREGGVFTTPFQLVLSTGDATETIRYTTDGSLPGPTSTLYTGPLIISSSARIRAQAFGSVGQVGNVVSEAFTRTSAETGSFSSDLPVVVLENFGQGTPGSGFEDAWLSLYDVDGGSGRSSLGNAADFTSLIGQHVRGSSTAGNPKTNLRIELRDEYGEDQGASLLDMPSESDWILYAPYNFDRAMIRNSALYDLYRQMGNYAARTRFVEVYANFDGDELEANDYMGVYVLMENLKIDDDRIDIAKLTPAQNDEPEVTGGYLFKIDRSDGVPGSSWHTSRGVPTESINSLVHVEPEITDLTVAQRDYIRGYVQDFEDALYGPNSTDPILGYEAYLDVDATIDHHLMQVFTKNPDGLRLSTYLEKDRDGKLSYGPIWDFDRAAGPDDDSRAVNANGWYVPDIDWFETDWWDPLFDDPDFTQWWVDRWHDLRRGVLSDANIQATIDGQAVELAEAEVRNFDRWPNIAPNGGPYAQAGLTGWEAEISQFTGWLIARAHWIDSRLIPEPELSPAGGNVPGNTIVTLSSNEGRVSIYYTLDGSDPRDDGGAISPSAILYTGPFAITQSTEVVARVLGSPLAGNPQGMNSPWSAQVAALYSVETPADATNLRITELHYHPADSTPAELALAPGTTDRDFEFIELRNISAGAISLNGVQFTSGITFDFTGSSLTSLAPGQLVLAVSNITAFQARYGTDLPVAGTYSGQLSNGGEEIELIAASGQTILEFEYEDSQPWPETPDGDGPSLQIVDVHGDYNSPANWQASQTAGGTPGVAPGLPGDFNNDSSVDGLDFLAWQRGAGSTYGSDDLADWQANYGSTESATVQATTELAVETAVAAEITADSGQYVILSTSMLAADATDTVRNPTAPPPRADFEFDGTASEPIVFNRTPGLRIPRVGDREAWTLRPNTRSHRERTVDLVLAEWVLEKPLQARLSEIADATNELDLT